MGPPPFGDGYLFAEVLGGRLDVASMGPPPFGDGYVEESFEPVGRVFLLQWGHRLSAMDTWE